MSRVKGQTLLLQLLWQSRQPWRGLSELSSRRALLLQPLAMGATQRLQATQLQQPASAARRLLVLRH